MRLAVLIVFSLFLVLPANAQNQSVNATALLDKVQEKYNEIEGFRADFKQRLKSASSKREEFREGHMAYKKPSFIRWENITPEEETLIVGQDMVWNYFPQEDSVYIYPVSQALESKTVINLLSGGARLDEEFVVLSVKMDEGLVQLGLTPKEPEPSLVEARLWVEPDTGWIRRVLAFDFYFNENEVSFTSLEQAQDLPDDLFVFNPPSGVEVYDNRISDARVEEKDLSQ